jgi:Flp pilus assembly protein protease CpaA
MSSRAADVAAAAWGSFLGACLGAFLFFGVFDPGRLGEASDVFDSIGRMTGYAVLFFFFWLISAVGAGFTLLMIRTSRREMRRRARVLRAHGPDRDAEEVATRSDPASS